ncbi:alpha-glucosidase maltase [Lecanicillium sp. MT-2017a]|nr:alpha-glucosidase maltase [Lecanicillium sp. MT-2017a]
MEGETPKPWWKSAVVYQIWPASFKDSNADGMGDLRGILESLDHIQSLGADTIWISPVYDSPQVDLGYDISDYERIYEPYGTMSDMEDVIKGCHSRGLRILMDLVINHTSDQHAWFKESRSSKTSSKRDWYIWQPAKYENGVRQPPNNWKSMFGGSAWEWDEQTEEYYLHLFAAEQPDVNWANRALREAVYQSAIRFWLDKGIDGFRIDTMGLFTKDQTFADASESEPHAPFNHRPETFQVFNEIHGVISQYGDLMTVGEFGGLGDTNMALKYVGAAERRVNMGFPFETVCIGYALSTFDVKPFSVDDFRTLFAKWQQFIEGTDGWTTVFLENHDVARSVSRFGTEKPECRVAAAKMLALLQIASTGTLFLYQGQEIGMTNIPKEWPIEEYKDVSTQQHWQAVKECTNDPECLEKAMDNIRKVARDHSRTPMQWSSQAYGGFTTAENGPWMRLNDNYTDINVADQEKDNGSVLSFWRRALATRKECVELLAHGTFTLAGNNDENMICFEKSYKEEKALIILNVTEQDIDWTPPADISGMALKLATSTELTDGRLGPFEGRLYLSSC